MYLDKLGLTIPILRQIIGFIYLTFVPGFLILKILKINNNSITETLAYSVGLSLSFLMFVGALMNYFGPLLGFSKPISEIPLIVIISIVVLSLCVIWFVRDKSYSIQLLQDKFFHPSILFFVLIPFLVVIGTQLLRFHNTNLPLLIFLGIISVVPLLVTSKSLPESIYPLALWSISISLLFHSMLICPVKLMENEIIGVVAKNGFWNPSVSVGQNSLLAVIMILPIFSEICGASILLSFYIFFPLQYSITPLVLYQVFKTQTTNKVAFLSAILFMFVFPFYTIIVINVRTGFAELFLALLLLILVNNNSIETTVLSMIFAFSLINSHYAASYIYMLALLLALSIISFLSRVQKTEHCKENHQHISLSFIILYITLLLSWYMYTAGSYNLIRIPKFFLHIKNVLSEFISPTTSYLAYGLQKNFASLSIEILKYLYLFLVFLIGIGVLRSFYKRIFGKKIISGDEYLSLSGAFLILNLVLSLSAGSFGIYRAFHISLIFLAPFTVIGLLELLEMLKKIPYYFIKNSNNILKFFSIFLMIFLLFNSGFISEIFIRGGDYSPNILISKERLIQKKIENVGDVEMKDYLYRYYTPICDIKSISWLVNNSDKEREIYTDFLGWISRFRMIPDFREIKNNKYTTIQPISIIAENESIKKGYITLFYPNIHEGILIERRSPLKYFNIDNICDRLHISSKIYTNGGSEIYYR